LAAYHGVVRAAGSSSSKQPDRITNADRRDPMNRSVLKKFEKEYGVKRGKQVMYATASKQGRNPETFRKQGARSRKRASAGKSTAR
jgi:hypothetical protein